MSLISVIISAFNAGNLINRALEGLKSQTISDWELIVIDDASEDNTAQLIRDFAATVSNKVKYIRNNSNRKIAICRNIGLDSAQGDYIAFLDADDFWASEHLENGLNMLQVKAQICYSGIYIYDRAANKILSTFVPDRAILDYPLESIFKKSFIQTSSSVILTKKAASSVGRFDESLAMGEDRDYWLRALISGYKLVYSGRLTCYYNKHSTNMMRNTMALSESEVSFYRKYLGLENISYRLRKKCYAASLFNHARLIRKSDPQKALNEFLEARKFNPAAFYYLFWILFTKWRK